MQIISFVEKNIHGAWVIHGVLGYRQYYYHTKAEAMKLYKDEAKEKVLPFVNQSVKSV